MDLTEATQAVNQLQMECNEISEYISLIQSPYQRDEKGNLVVSRMKQAHETLGNLIADIVVLIYKISQIRPLLSKAQATASDYTFKNLFENPKRELENLYWSLTTMKDYVVTLEQSLRTYLFKTDVNI
jgi:uncharacterized protein YihD (DUF1040 family)